MQMEDPRKPLQSFLNKKRLRGILGSLQTHQYLRHFVTCRWKTRGSLYSLFSIKKRLRGILGSLQTHFTCTRGEGQLALGDMVLTICSARTMQLSKHLALDNWLSGTWRRGGVHLVAVVGVVVVEGTGLRKSYLFNTKYFCKTGGGGVPRISLLNGTPI
jgi:hypothetical protein